MTDHERGIEAAQKAVSNCRYGLTNSEMSRAISAYLSAVAPQAGDNAAGDGEAEIIECLSAGKPFVFDPATNFLHADDGGAPDGGIKYAPVDSHPCTSTTVVYQNAPALEDKGGEVAADPIDCIKAMMEERGLTNVDLYDIFGAKSRVSEILRRKRSLRVSHIRQLHERFGIPLEKLVAAYQLDTDAVEEEP
jgi:antitoxin component HigA of HigAB toxin-antitoxin module